jgi:hypothetical protein
MDYLAELFIAGTTMLLAEKYVNWQKDAFFARKMHFLAVKGFYWEFSSQNFPTLG